MAEWISEWRIWKRAKQCANLDTEMLLWATTVNVFLRGKT